MAKLNENTKETEKKQTAPKKEEATSTWLAAFGDEVQEGFEEDNFTRDNVIKISKDVNTKGFNIFIYDDLEDVSPEAIDEVEAISKKKLNVSLLSYKHNRTRFEENGVACAATMNIDGNKLHDNNSVCGRNTAGEDILCSSCRYNAWGSSNNIEQNPKLQCKVGYFMYLYSPDLGKVLRLATSPSGNKNFKDMLVALGRARKADQNADGNPHYNPEYVIEIGTEKKSNDEFDWLVFTFKLTGDKWEADKASEIIENVRDIKERIGNSPVPTTPMIAQNTVSQASATNEEGQVLNVEILNEDELPFEMQQ